MSKTQRTWSLREAKVKLSEIVRHAQAEGPQQLTLRGKHVATILPAEAQTPKTEGTGADLIAALQACPRPELFEVIDKLRDEERQFAQRVNDLLAKDDAKQLRKQGRA